MKAGKQVSYFLRYADRILNLQWNLIAFRIYNGIESQSESIIRRPSLAGRRVGVRSVFHLPEVIFVRRNAGSDQKSDR